MNRALKEKVRKGPKGTQPLPGVGKPAFAQNINNYDGRANTAAGIFEVKTERGTTPEGQQVNWQGFVDKD